MLNCEDHSKLIHELDVDDIYNALTICKSFFRKVYEVDRKAKYCSINLNFLFPAGASQPHAHLQVIQDYKLTWFQRLVLIKSKRYYEKYNSCYWVDLIESEDKLSERIFFKGLTTTWITSFAPILNGEVIGVVNQNYTSIIQLNESEIEDLAKDLHEVLRRIHNKLHALSINLTIFDLGFMKPKPYFKLHVRLIVRKELSSMYVNDVGFMEIIHLEPVITIMPEELAKILK